MSWHALSSEEVLARLETSPLGLSDTEAARRLSRDGVNELPPAPKPHPLLRFLAQFNNALILFLVIAAVIAGALGHWVDALVIVMVVTINALVGFIQEGRAEQALHALHEVLATTTTVVRGGKHCSVPVRDLVRGDIVLLAAGDRTPADLRLLHARGLLVDESLLTGESQVSEKSSDPVEEEGALGDRKSMVYSGTLVRAGHGTAVVAETGARTQIGRIGQLLASVDVLSTPLLQQIARFGRRFTTISLIAGGLLFLFAVIARGYDWLDALIVVIALTVSAVPEGLPAVITITLAIGVQRMAARNAIVRRLPAVETLGATTAICSDKTGTLTRNEMTARRLVTAGGEILVSGSGYAPRGDLSPAQARPDKLISCGVLCNDAELREVDAHWSVHGDPMEGALISMAIKAGSHPSELRAQYVRRDEIPFDAEHRFMATLHESPEGEVELFVKGAPERIFAASRHELSSNGRLVPLAIESWQRAVERAAGAGERVLAFAWRRLDRKPQELGFDQVDNLIFLGLVGFIDPPRDEAFPAIADCRSAGIAVKMITGDHAATAAAIARQLRLADEPKVVSGQDLEGVTDEALSALALQTTVFARTSPEHKLRVVRALQSQGAVVAMTGDGVNDAPSLKQADVGIAMGQKGTEAAKEASEIVLTDDNFASIVAAVHEGRTVYDNIRKVIAWTLPTNAGEVLTITAALALGLTLPMTAPQILWINMILTITLGLVLAFEPAEPHVMKLPPRRPDEPLLSPFMLWRVVLVSLLFMAGALGTFEWARYRGLDISVARTMVVNAICVMETAYLFNVRYLHTGSLSFQAMRGTRAIFLASFAVIAAQFAFTYAPFMQVFFDTAPIPFVDGVLIVCLGVILLFLLELEKALLRRLNVFSELRHPS